MHVAAVQVPWFVIPQVWKNCWVMLHDAPVLAAPNSKLRLEKQLKEQKEIEVGKRACGFQVRYDGRGEVEGTFRVNLL